MVTTFESASVVKTLCSFSACYAAAATVNSVPDTPTQSRPQEGYDIVLSSGFLAFAQHCGFLQAANDLQLPINSIMGTSSGAMIGSMYSAGHTPKEIAA
jgi:predicted acylesterase/phospholipase RssA